MVREFIPLLIRRRAKEVAEAEARLNARPLASGIEVSVRRLIASAAGLSSDHSKGNSK